MFITFVMLSVWQFTFTSLLTVTKLEFKYIKQGKWNALILHHLHHKSQGVKHKHRSYKFCENFARVTFFLQ